MSDKENLFFTCSNGKIFVSPAQDYEYNSFLYSEYANASNLTIKQTVTEIPGQSANEIFNLTAANSFLTGRTA